MEQAAAGEMIHEFHIEAAIASVHANASSYESTDWKLILNLYNLLLEKGNNPMVTLNRCLVVGEVEGYEKAIDELQNMKGLSENCHYNTSLGELYMKAGNKTEASKYFCNALPLTSSVAEMELIRRKINMCS